MPKTLMQSVVSQLQKERTRLEDELHRITTALVAFGNAWKGLSSRSRSRLSNSVISPAVLGLLILFNARKMCSPRRRLKFGIFFIAGSTVSNNRPSQILQCLPRL